MTTTFELDDLQKQEAKNYNTQQANSVVDAALPSAIQEGDFVFFAVFEEVRPE